MQINITYDASVDSAPAGFKAAVDAAVAYLESVLLAPITVNIAVGWGEVGGQSLVGAVGASTASQYALSYAEIRNALWRDAVTPDALAAAEALPASDPTHGGTILVTSAEAKALGLADPLDPSLDGAVGLGTGVDFSFDPNNRSQPGLVDAIGALEHEITEVLGRQSFLGEQPGDSSSLFGVLDLFRYTAPGQLAPSSASGSFSINGQTLLLPFDNPVNGGDSGDWSQAVTGDSFDAFADTGTAGQISSTDLRLMDVLGYHAKPQQPVTPLPNVAPSSPVTVNQSMTIPQGQTVYFAGGSQVVAYSLENPVTQNPPPAPSLTNAGTVVVIASQAIAIGVRNDAPGQFDNSVVTNAVTGVFEVEASGSAAAFGVDSQANGSSDFDNAGVWQIVSPGGLAAGVVTEGLHFHFTNEATGQFSVWAAGFGEGVSMRYGGAFTNAGSIVVVGGAGGQVTNGNNNVGFIGNGAGPIEAMGVIDATSFSNSGVLKVTNLAPGAVSVGVDIRTSTATFTNSGVIEADFAFLVDQEAFSHVDTFTRNPVNVSITNTGMIIGSIGLDNGNNTIVNSGTIGGTIYLGDGNSVYDGASGHLYGAIVLGHGVNTVKLGGDGDTVYGGGGADRITGGSGDDVVFIARGANALDGGGGFNTLSFEPADTGVMVDLGQGTASAAGADTIKNFQRILGSNFDDTITAGSTAAVLIGGGGHDTLTGGAGADTLVASTGGGVSKGGEGADTFIYSTGDHALVVSDFLANGDADVLKVFGYGSAKSVQQQGADTLITLSNSDTILLKNVPASSLNSGNLIYSSAPYALPAIPSSFPVFGSSFIDFNYDFTIAPGELIQPTTLYFDAFFGQVQKSYVGLIDDGILTAPGNRLASFDNFGHVNIAAALTFDFLIGLSFTGTQPSGGAFTNEAGATFAVTSTGGGPAEGLAAGDFSPTITNAGAFSVSAGGTAEGVLDYQLGVHVTNAATGVFATTSSSNWARGLELFNGGVVDNEGQISVTGSGQPYVRGSGQALITAAIWMARFESSSIVNNGAITATPNGGGAVAYGIAVSGIDQPAHPSTITNHGTITAAVAILDFDEPGTSPANAPSVAIVNTGTINGDIDLGGSSSSLTNTGAITGNVYLHLDTAFFASGFGDVIDMRGGTFSGFIDISSGWDAGNSVVHDTIYTDAGSTLIKIAGGESKLTVTVNGAANGQTTVQFDIASTAATWVHNPDGTWTVNAGTDGTETLTNVQTLQFTDKSVSLAAPQVGVKADFNADARSDFLIQNTAGAVVVGEVGVGGQAGYVQVAGLGPEWAFREVGDLLGHGKADFMIENAAGAVALGEESAGGPAAYTTVGALGAEWSFRGVGDFLGLGHDQFLIENVAGAIFTGDVQNGVAHYAQIGALGPEWSFRGAGDFLDDGKDDFLIENAAGAVAVGEVVGGQAAYTVVGALGPEWVFRGTGDFLSDGKDAFLIENAAGAIAVGEVGANHVAAYTVVGALGPEWAFVGAGDFLAEGHDQFLIKNTAGAVFTGDVIAGAAHYAQITALGPEWHFHL